MRKFSDRSCRENENTHFIIFSPQKVSFYKIMWKKMGEPERPMVTTIKHGAEEMRWACLIT